jgi:hypothetical protein
MAWCPTGVTMMGRRLSQEDLTEMAAEIATAV